ncbi:MAG: hypothetical protein V4604_11755 [Bacteroidota bacterium]
MIKQLVLLFLFGWFYTACSKKADQLGSEYQSLVGKWEIVNQNAERVRITFKANGKILIENGADRGAKYKVTEVTELFPPSNPTPEAWHSFLLKTNGRQIVVKKKLGYVDTISTGVKMILIDTVGVATEFNFYRIKN